jgi:hypothetical protein
MNSLPTSDLLPRIFDAITPSSDFGTDTEWELIEQFVVQHATDDLAELTFAATDENTESWKIGALFDHLIWNTPDHGGALMKTVENWLRGDDPRRVEFALAMNYVFPFPDPTTMTKVFTQIKTRWPKFAERCDERIASRSRARAAGENLR